MEQSLTVTPERVRAAAAKCSTANQVLRELFPEAFKVETFKAGQHVKNKINKEIYLIPTTAVADALRAKWSNAFSGGVIPVLGIKTGECYCILPEYLELV